ncbi:hypothetical protein PAXRUDRAFT_834220 [Paxillus rubicundulus Ve08.2h10]|uniref:Uncharacterized protein n=1 Tax=Paxillus rubicundulus Ve08.2h10 TaxID=930991 RepID=A0A0D0C8C9_9AGAM|nr:hypothetical protein PAXRUDRAFT_834220 [Paxillus rubicundulus Ve08.2h10]
MSSPSPMPTLVRFKPISIHQPTFKPPILSHSFSFTPSLPVSSMFCTRFRFPERYRAFH